MPLPGPIPRPQQVEREVARAAQEEHEREWAQHRAEQELEPHRLRGWWRRVFGGAEEPTRDDPDRGLE
jgi:hypothetical protein